MTVFINHKMFDYSGNFIGSIGVGLTLDAVSRIVESYVELNIRPTNR